MDARKNPRTKTSFQVTFVSKANGVSQNRIISDISQSGLFANAMSGAKLNDHYRVLFRRPGQIESMQLNAQVTRIDSHGSALAFRQLDPQESRFLSELTKPNWDGKDLLEGVIKHGVLENTTSFASCMRLTSLLSSDYRFTSRGGIN
ncbi:MAG: PilZ domain-containing protein [Candidatus Thiodiazotropha taylori]|nr:PilZ domain-containing protein [Candidatus Thiodiazotropha taylori]MCG7997168.1 PilZ domain-containing protein [Candidatus Thiodiazotropha taylori]MCG8038186.1 PilZ domain-containing protein [Candidatus Thiodiazotropha taylori]MCG8073432.1 PilZ domain-containing protein [Candidatus Thiodiazotropha taylori]MCW4327453.1 PilZ domain-containing protein [Candidatus Thiodiazotropha taylori]